MLKMQPKTWQRLILEQMGALIKYRSDDLLGNVVSDGLCSGLMMPGAPI
jgi:hypothetical protein